MDPRVRKLARVLLNYSLNVRKGQLLKIQGEVVSMPLIKAAFEEAVRIGAHPYIQIIIPDSQETLLRHGSDAQLKHVSPMTKLEIGKIDALLAILGAENTRFLSGVDPKRQAIMRKTRHPYMAKMLRRSSQGTLNWVGTQFPTPANAQEAEMSLSEYEDFVYRAGHLNTADPVKHWKQVAKEQMRLKKILERFDRLHVRADDTDLKLRAKGREWVSCHGKINFPDGEIFTSPIEDTVEGKIRFSFPAVYMAREVEDVSLEFKRGKVVGESASKNQRFLTEMLNMDRGARYVGEFAIGTNYGIRRFSKNTLFDEKMGGTCHLAVGMSYPGHGGKNTSALHWDMVCDLKKGGEIAGDGKVIYRNGRFTI